MNTKVSTVRNALFLAMFASAPVFADAMLVVDHNAAVGPKHDALMNCAEAARSSALGHGLMFAARQGAVHASGQGNMTVILTGTSWENGQRVPVTARCVTGPRQEVASVTIVNTQLKVATAQ